MLADLRVIDLSTDVAGAYAAKLLAGFGADVIKVEAPEGDPTRPMPPRASDHPDGGLLFAYLNTGKRSVVLEVSDGGQRERLLALLATADLIVESGAPGEWASRGVDFEALMAARPGLVICSITPFGQDGPRAAWRATALTAFAAGGQMMICGDPDRPPLKTAGHQAYYQAGLHGFAASLTALFAARRDGVGDRIDISAQEAQAASLEGAGPQAMVHGFDAGRSGNQARAIWGIYPCADGYVGVASMARQAGSVYECIGRPDLAGDPAFRNLLANPEYNDLVGALITEWAAGRTALEIFAESERHRAPFSLIPGPRDLLDWGPLREAGFWVELDHPVIGRHTVPSSSIEVDGSRGEQRRAPLLGEHTEAVLAEVADGDKVAPTAPPEATERVARPPLDGVRVLDLTQVWAGPYGTRFLADMGADVIHVEGPAFPDAVRGVGRTEDPRGFNKSAYFNEYNRNKRGLALDLGRPEGLEACRRLVRAADVVVENWSVGVAERLGLGYEDLRALNPRIILVQMPGFSRGGVEASRVGFGPTIEQMGGLVALQGYEGGPPHKSGISYGDPVAGIAAAGATALALLRREQSGAGSHVVVYQRDNVVGLAGEFIVAESAGYPLPLRIGNRDLLCAPHNVYRAQDGEPRMQMNGAELTERWLALAVDSDEAWRGLCAVVGDDRLRRPEYETAEGRRAADEEIDAVIAGWVRERDPDKAAEALQAAGVSASPVLSPLMLTRDAHLRARGYYLRCDHPEAGEHLTTRPVWRLARRPVDSVRPAPCFGEHNEAVLSALAGYGQAEIARLAELGVIAEAPLSA